MTATAPVADRPLLSFEEDSHTYAVEGRVVPSVTTVLKAALGDILWPWANEFAMERGRRVHQAVHYYTQGDLDTKSLSEAVAGYVAAAVRFIAETGFELRVSEHRMFSSAYDFAGTLDWNGVLDRKRSIIDLKTGEPGYGCGPQTAAYAHLWQEETGEVITHRYGLQLFADGSYKLIRYPSREDWPDFLACLRVYHLRQRIAK